MIEISDFQCPFCSKYVTETFSAIRREFIDPGVVRYVAMHFPLERIHARAFAAAEAAECAATQGRYWQMHARLFSQPAALQEADFANHAQELELDHVRFDQCLRDDHSVEIVRADLKEAEELGVAGTPTFFLGFAAVDGRVELVKRINGAAPLDVFVRELRALLSR